MNLNPVNSSRMRAVGWERDTMYAEFHDGAVYAYESVPRAEYESFIASQSPGRELSRLDKRHRYRRVR